MVHSAVVYSASSSHDSNAHARPYVQLQGQRPRLDHLVQDQSRHNHTLDLGSTLVDLEDLRIAHKLLDGVLAVETVAAKDLYSIGRVLVGDIPGHGLGDAVSAVVVTWVSVICMYIFACGHRAQRTKRSRCCGSPRRSYGPNATPSGETPRRCTSGECISSDCTTQPEYYPMAISASIKAMAWCSQMGLPMVLRSIEYLAASSTARRARPTAPAATAGRVISKAPLISVKLSV